MRYPVNDGRDARGTPHRPERPQGVAVESRAEDNVVDYRVTTDVEEPDTGCVFERYENDDAVDAPLASDYFESF